MIEYIANGMPTWAYILFGLSFLTAVITGIAVYKITKWWIER